jgi:hypothetical protein
VIQITDDGRRMNVGYNGHPGGSVHRCRSHGVSVRMCYGARVIGAKAFARCIQVEHTSTMDLSPYKVL